MEFLNLAPCATLRGTVALPGSKSISNRMLLLAALATGKTLVHGVLEADDTDRMLEALQQLGIHLTQQAHSRTFCIEGCDGRWPVRQADLFLGNAGTAFRPLTAALALAGGDYHLHGIARMHERPIGDLVEALQGLGAVIEYAGTPGYPPLHIHPGHVTPGSTTRVKGNVSSQFLSALLMALPLAGGGTVEVEGELISKPYVDLTLRLIERFGVTVGRDGYSRFTVEAGSHYRSPGAIHVEGDASSASYFLAAGALGGGPVRVTGVGRNSIQGDIRFADALAAMGAVIDMGDDWIEAQAPASGRLRAVTLDCNHIPDAAMTLAVAALFANGTTTLTNIASWRVKETDRIAAMATELGKLGALVETGHDFIRITPPDQLTPGAAIDTYDDHRMAMCFSLASLAVPVRINDPRCVAKTFPGYFDVFASLRA